MKSFATYLKVVYPPLYVSLRTDRGPIWKLTKWLGLRVAFVLYRLNVSANVLNVFMLFAALFAFWLLLSAQQGETWRTIVGLLILFTHPFIDFVDGAVSRAHNCTSEIGALLDDIGPEVDRVLVLLLFAIYSRNELLIMLSIFSSFILVFFIKTL